MVRYDDSYNKNKRISGLAVHSKRLIGLTSPTVCTSMHNHRDFEILYVTSGRAEFYIAGKRHNIGENGLLLINPYEAHSGTAVSGEFEYFCINFDFSYINHPLCEKILDGELIYNNVFENSEGLLPYLRRCFEYITEEKNGWNMRAVGELMIFFSYLDDFIFQADVTKEHKFAKSILVFLEKHYSEEITTQSVANILCYDKSWFCRKFKTAFSCTFSEYLKFYRISKAKELLAQNGISATALKCGFSSINYFGKCFKDVTGITPGEYKKILTLTSGQGL